ncbi:MAG: hypothetical protein FWG73_03250 [Planctomycetaceae bacterium]|nr:hypothetical protein [Planctomycetaceae bacterium]
MSWRLIRQFSLILWAVFLLASWNSTVFAQSDPRAMPNRNTRDRISNLASGQFLNGQPANSTAAAAELVREMRASWQNLPWQDLSSDAQSKIRSVISSNPLFHRMPSQTVYSDPEIYRFLLQNPTVVIGFWEQLGSTQLSLQEVKANQYILRETGGTAAAIEVLYRTDELCILYVRGEYRGPLLAKSYQGNAVLVLRTQFTQDDVDEPMIVCDLDVFVQINNLGADMLAKLFFSSLTKVADNNFEVTISFISQVSKAAAYNTLALKSTAEEISSISSRVYDEFCEIVDGAAVRFTQRNQATPFTAESTRHPVQRANMEKPRNEVLPMVASSFYTAPPEHWSQTDLGTDRFIDTPLPPYTAIRYQHESGLSAPKPLVSNPARHIIPRLPRR